MADACSGSFSDVGAQKREVCFAPEERTCLARSTMSEKCHLQTHAVQQIVGLLNHLDSTAEQRKWDVQPQRSGCLEVDDQFNLGPTGSAPPRPAMFQHGFCTEEEMRGNR